MYVLVLPYPLPASTSLWPVIPYRYSSPLQLRRRPRPQDSALARLGHPTAPRTNQGHRERRGRRDDVPRRRAESLEPKRILVTAEAEAATLAPRAVVDATKTTGLLGGQSGSRLKRKM
jgi:hypothetical protein